MRKSSRKLALNRDTVRNLSQLSLEEAAGGNLRTAQANCTIIASYGSCYVSCNVSICNIQCVAPTTSNLC